MRLDFNYGFVLVGNVLERLKEIPDGTIHCCVTSPPYWGLRDYGADGQIGLEKTPEEYVEKLVRVFREVRRALHPSGTLWLNLGDSYASQGGHRSSGANSCAAGRAAHNEGVWNTPHRPIAEGLKPKDLVGIPWMVAFALRAEGWYLRSEVIWAKGNCMPESVFDRPTRSHEQIFLFAKSPRYFYDEDAIREPQAKESYDYTPGRSTEERKEQGHPSRYGLDGAKGLGLGSIPPPVRPQMKRAMELAEQHGLTQDHLDAIRAVGLADPGSKRESLMTGAGKNTEEVIRLAAEAKAVLGSYYKEFADVSGGRNKRSVWHINPKPYPEAHFAVFPEEIPNICIKAGTSEKGCCPTCKAPWDRDGEDWVPTCQCPPHEPEPCVVLDPFAGSGTTLAVACWLRRRYAGVELNPKYAKLIEKRLRQPEAEESQRAAFDLMMTMDED